MNILWDFDGTLFDTYPAFTEVIYHLLKGQVPKVELLAKLKISFSDTVSYYGLTEKQVNEFKKNELAISPAQKKPFPFLEKIINRADVNVIMTHKPRDEVNTILDFYGWGKYFVEIVAGDDGFPRKPNASAYRYLHEKFSLSLAVGDRILDILPAQELGIPTCLFQNKTPGADFYLDSYQDFFKVISL